MTELATGRARSIGGPQIGASTTVDPRDNFPAVFATTHMIALMELAGARILHPLLLPGQMSVGAHVDVGHRAATHVLAGAARRS